MNSTDNSVNISSVSGDRFFVRLRETAGCIDNKADREKILDQVERLEKAQGSPGFADAYQRFVAAAAQYMTMA
jgi:hypothetical protein